MKTNITKGKEVLNFMRRTDKHSECSTELVAHMQILKQQKQLNDRNPTYLSILTLNVNGLNSPIKRHCLVNWTEKEDLTICCLQENNLIDRNKHRVRAKGWKDNLPCQWPWKTGRINNTYIR
jgi:hypothetical protein